tara:strand:+ start:1958 stop:2578 length:621 start_codon:yes stop_codon:yes gene_type:complete
MRKLEQKQIRAIKRNLNYFFNNATNEQINQGIEWYEIANKEANKIAKKYNLEVYKVAQVISALSPRNKWEQNIKDANKLCEAYTVGLHPTDIKVCTFHSNKFKAFNILASNVQITNNSLKTYNFVNNIAYLSSEHVTVDIWHLRACFKNNIKINSANIGKIAYKQIKDITINIANKLGLKPYDLQAIIWISTQNYFNNNIKLKHGL